MASALDLVRLFAGATVLAFASYTDWKWRRAPNALWIALAVVGVVVLAAEVALDPEAALGRWPYLAFVPGFAAVIYAFWYFGLVAGGADAKALMALGVLLPYPLALSADVPPLQTPVPGSFAVLGNSLLFFLAIPLSLLLWNAARGDFRLPHALLGVRRRASDVRRGHAWPMETVDAEGRRRSRLFSSRMSPSELDEQLERIQALGAERVWVTPKIPFMIPLLLGFVAAFVAGDLLTSAIAAAMPVP